jgi:hypothetical protein
MATSECDTLLSQCEKISQKFKENLGNSRNLSTIIKDNLQLCLKELKNIIKQQNLIILNQEKYINNELKVNNERYFDTTQQLREEINVIKQHLFTKSYSEAVKTQLEPQKVESSQEVVIIRPKSESDDVNKTAALAKQIIVSKQLKTKVKNIRNITKGGIVIECGSAEDCDSIIRVINDQNNEIIAAKPKKKVPKLVINGVSNNVNEQQLLIEIMENSCVKNFMETISAEEVEEQLKVKFKFRNHRSNSDNTWVIEVSPQLRKVIFNSGTNLLIGWKSCKFSDYLQIIRCYHCNGFGHIAKECKQTAISCGHCGQQHNTKDCTADRNSTHCTNCDRHNKAKNQKTILPTNHSSYSHSCESFKRIKHLISSKTQYE